MFNWLIFSRVIVKNLHIVVVHDNRAFRKRCNEFLQKARPIRLEYAMRFEICVDHPKQNPSNIETNKYIYF